MADFKPMLAAKADFAKIRYPILASPKLDGIRATVVEGRLLTRTLKEVPNRFIFHTLSKKEYEGWDGELICGSSTDRACYRNTVSGVMTIGETPQFVFYVFDIWTRAYGWSGPLSSTPIWTCEHAIALDHVILENQEEMEEYEASQIALGFEGIILRDPDGPYKFGRSTVNEGYLLKVKRFEDSEGVLIGMEEEERNDNELGVDERGYAHRTSHKENKSGKGRMGALIIRDLGTGVKSKIGTGFSAEEREWFWDNRERLVSSLTCIVKYRFFKYGVKDLPRHSSYLGLRPEGA